MDTIRTTLTTLDPEEIGDTYDHSFEGCDPAEVDRIAESMRANGWIGEPVLIDSGLVIVHGRHRVQAAILAGLVEIPVMVIDYDDLREIEAEYSCMEDLHEALKRKDGEGKKWTQS